MATNNQAPTQTSPEYKLERVKAAYNLFKRNESLQREIITFMQEDVEIKATGWNSSPMAYLQMLLAEHAMDQLGSGNEQAPA